MSRGFRPPAAIEDDREESAVGELSMDACHMTLPLRTGRRVGRHLYAQLGAEPSDDDPAVGTVDSPVLAERIVRAVNEVDGREPDEDERTLHVGDKVHVRWLDESGYHHGRGLVASADGEAFKVRVELVGPDRRGAMPSLAFDGLVLGEQIERALRTAGVGDDTHNVRAVALDVAEHLRRVKLAAPAQPAVAPEEPSKTTAEVLHDLGSGGGPGWRRTTHCCADMTRRLAETCEDHPYPWDCPDLLVTGPPQSNEYGLWVHDGGSSYIVIRHCPWCGAKLGDSPAVAPDTQSAAPTRDAPLVEAEEKPGGLWCVIATIAGRRTSIYAAHDRAHIRNVVRDINAAHVERRVADTGLGVLRGGGADGGGEDGHWCETADGLLAHLASIEDDLRSHGHRLGPPSPSQTGDAVKAALEAGREREQKNEDAAMEALAEVERLSELADQMASALAPSVIVGEHSSANDPWLNALQYAGGPWGSPNARYGPEEQRVVSGEYARTQLPAGSWVATLDDDGTVQLDGDGQPWPLHRAEHLGNTRRTRERSFVVVHRAPAPTPAPLTVGEVVTGTRAVSAPVGTKLGAKKAAVAAVHTTGGWSVTGMNHEQDHEEHVRLNEWVVLALPASTTTTKDA